MFPIASSLSLFLCVCVCKVRSVQKTNCHTAARGGGGGEKRKVKQRRLCSSRRCCDPESGLRRVNHRVQNALQPSFFVFCNNNKKIIVTLWPRETKLNVLP